MLQEQAQERIPSPELVLKLAKHHVNRFRRYRAAAMAGEPGYRLQELNELLWLWQGTQIKEGRWELMSVDQRRTVLDAWRNFIRGLCFPKAPH